MGGKLFLGNYNNKQFFFIYLDPPWDPPLLKGVACWYEFQQ